MSTSQQLINLSMATEDNALGSTTLKEICSTVLLDNIQLSLLCPSRVGVSDCFYVDFE